jgi:type II secretory pathway component PulK
VALVAAVGGLAVVTMLAVAAAQWALAGTRLAQGVTDALQAEAALRSGVTIAAVLLEEEAARRDLQILDGLFGETLLTRRLGTASITLRFEDAARRLDLNAPELGPAVRRLGEALGLDPGFGDVLADWTDADDVPRPRGAERAWYLAASPPLVPPNAPLGSLAELSHLRGVGAEALARLAPFVATAGERAVNPNTAAPEVLAAWLGSADTAAAMLARRARSPLACAGMPACTTRSQASLVHVTAVVHGVRRAVVATLWVPPAGPAEVRALQSSDPEERGEAVDVAKLANERRVVGVAGLARQDAPPDRASE